ncbi:unnamed protein product [Symbiodinium necroappetens]|uniref:Uncharacterized protein n=1 Tax=Symbiodinium necroappetens TaxID=1628268 RepID=A0A812ZR02_9DINO|nr:unnamed protein product [Symbiodinium necroappetens]
MLDRANSPHQGHAEEQENREDLSIHLGPLHMMESLAESSASLAWLAIRRNGEDQGNRFASTVDPMDGQTTLSLGSAHYTNFFGDAPWELCGRESHEDLRSNRNTRGFVVLGLFRVLA